MSLVELTPVGGDSKKTEREEAQEEKKRNKKRKRAGKKEGYQHWTGKRKGKGAEEERV